MNNNENLIVENSIENADLSIEDNEIIENLSIEDDIDNASLFIEEPTDLIEEQKKLLKNILNERKNKVQK